MKDGINIPPKFWATLPPAEFKALLENGSFLNAEQCARLWRMTDRQTEPPKSLQVRVNVTDLLREFPPSRQQRRAAERSTKPRK